MIQMILLDIPREPAAKGALLAVVLGVLGFILLIAAGLVVFLWYRKRSLRGVEMVRPDSPPAAPHRQPNSPNQP
jgi:flagellar basal body-associated protein FliL